jgi:xanthine dehydrogenase molybdopterin-binding subunit B
MGQGLNTKVQQMVALKLGVPMASIHVHATSTGVIPNMSITGACLDLAAVPFIKAGARCT